MHFILFSGSQVGLPQKQSWGKKMRGSSLFRRRWPQEALVGVEEWGREREEVWMEPQQCWRYFWVLDCCLNLAWKPGTFWLFRESKQHCSLSLSIPTIPRSENKRDAHTHSMYFSSNLGVLVRILRILLMGIGSFWGWQWSEGPVFLRI